MSPRTPFSIALVVLLLLSGCIGNEGTITFEGTAISGPVAGDFTLSDQDGNQISLRDYSGDVVVVMFIFTRCPDVCPVTTQNLGEVSDILGDEMDGVTFLSISVDPEYDTQERLKSFAQKHGVDWPHLSGSLEESEKVWENFGIVVEKSFIDSHGVDNETENNSGGNNSSNDGHDDSDGHDHGEEEANYSVGHSTVMFILDKGQHKRVIWSGVSWVPEKVVNDIRILLGESH
jgi:cytochrome oxidase Cu insertion factor (SCO1/SenC/PrrC family)